MTQFMKHHSIAVLLATYNGERYLREQIDSIYAQTCKDWTIYAHDDGSTDGTVSILEEYESANDNFAVLRYPSQHGASGNFLSLLREVDADYYFFADQDDVWLPEKMETCMQRMNATEQSSSVKPVLVCSDAFVANADMSVRAQSLWQQAGTHPEFLLTFNESAATPFVTGCTMLVNKQAKQTVVWDKTSAATMHDAFITLCVLRADGIVSPIFKPLIYYRQHGDNALGAFSYDKTRGIAYKLSHFKSLAKKNIAILKMLHALGYGSVFKFLKYKRAYKKKCRKANMKGASK